MKALKTLIAIALSAGGLGTAVTLGAVANNNDKKSIQMVEAGNTTRLYLDMSGFADWYGDSASFKVHVWNGTNDVYTAATKVANAYWYADVDLSACSTTSCGWRFTRYSSDGKKEWNQGAWNSWSSTSTNTYYKPSGYTTGSWSKDDQKTWSIVGSTTGTWTSSTEDINIPLTLRFNDEGLQFINTSVNLTAGSVFKIKNSDASNNYYGYNALETGSGSVIAAGDVSGSGTGNVTVVNSGSYEVYMKPFAGKAWMQENSEGSAIAWADSFLAATNSICSTGGNSADHFAALNAIWADESTGTSTNYLRGTFNGWNTSTAMKRVGSSDIYRISNLTVSAGAEFKVDVGGSWSESYPDSNYVIEEAGVYVIEFNSSTHVIEVKEDVYLARLYGLLTTGAKNIIKNVSSSDVEEAVERYTHIVTRYQQLDDFIGDIRPTQSNYLKIISSQNVSIIIVVVAIVLISSTGLFFIVRKKKEQQ